MLNTDLKGLKGVQKPAEAFLRTFPVRAWTVLFQAFPCLVISFSLTRQPLSFLSLQESTNIAFLKFP